MVTATSLPALPDPKSIKDEASASDALTCTLAVVATANRKLATAPREDQPGGLHEDLAGFHEHLKGMFRELHELLPQIAYFRADITGWSVTVGMSNTLTVNFTNKHAQTGPDPEIQDKASTSPANAKKQHGTSKVKSRIIGGNAGRWVQG